MDAKRKRHYTIPKQLNKSRPSTDLKRNGIAIGDGVS